MGEQFNFCKRVPVGGSTPTTTPPTGACVSNDPNIDYSITCKALEATCEQFSFCKCASYLSQSSAMHSAPVRQLRRLRRSTHHVLIQQGSGMKQGTLADYGDLDGAEHADVNQPVSAALHADIP